MRAQTKFRWHWLIAVSQIGIALYFFAWPAMMVARALFDTTLASPEPAAQAWELHRALSRRFARWADQRRASQAAEKLAQSDISGTEWPAYGAVFYLRDRKSVV